jgi:ATP-dependent helicase HrpB
VAARAAAARIAAEQGWTVGREVGYHVRFDRKISRDTRICVLTEGILTRQLLDDPSLDGIGAVLLDEFHERSLHTDIAIALLREVQQSLRPDLVLIVMSATLAAEPVARFLGEAPIVRSEGRMFPIATTYRSVAMPDAVEAVPSAIHDLFNDPNDDGGDVLVFLPGMEEIRRVGSRLQSGTGYQPVSSSGTHGLAARATGQPDVLPLHGSLTAEEQDAALRPSNRRKIILATNIAETSLTIEGVTAVIDSGLARIASYDAERGLDRLDLSRISRASAEQRAGRAGRTAPGRAVRLWSEKEHHVLRPFDEPEVRRVDLAGTALSLHAWGVNPRTFGWFEPPTPESLNTAEGLLEMLGALTNGKITPLGSQMVNLPMHPRLARLLVGAVQLGLTREGATLAAMLSEKDILPWTGERQAKVIGDSDVLYRLQRLESGDRSLDHIAVKAVNAARHQFLNAVVATPAPPWREEATQASQLQKLVLLAYPDRVAKRRPGDPTQAVMVGGSGVRIGDESIVKNAEIFVAVDARRDSRSRNQQAIVRIASAVEPSWLEELFPQSIRRQATAEFDKQRGRVIGVRRTLYRDLPLREDLDAPVSDDDAARVLAEVIAPRVEELLRSDEKLAPLVARLQLLKEHMPEHPWLDVSGETASGWLESSLMGARSLDDAIRRLPGALKDQLVYPLDRLLEQHAPETIEVPTGNRIKIDYKPGQRPVLAVRLQEVFGWLDTPRIAGGRVPLLMHLLGPNYRPVQITDDLRSFWSTTYFQVRKDLRVRYPKHSWPEDPLTATPQAKGRPRQ